MFVQFCLLFGLCMTQVYHVQSIQVDLPVGSVVGKEDVTAEGNKFYSFLGIPYGEPPIDALRFKAPVERKPWKGVFNATQEGKRCRQRWMNRSKTCEGCLVLNIYTPAKAKTNGPVPVMIYIYGGGFMEGSSDPFVYGGDHFVDKDVILVTFNYRIGPFGFLSFGDVVAPGNAGLKDQLLALKWTHKYIQHFGGNPDQITIFGESAGAASVAYHLLNSQTSGLYRAAILQSGTSLCAWSLQRNLTEVSHKLAQRINDAEYKKVKNSPQALLAFLQSVPADDIQKAYESDFPDMTVPRYNVILDGFYFTPTIEPEHDGAFLTEKMYGLLESGKFNKVPTMIGFTTLEWGGLQFDGNLNKIVNAFDEDIGLVVPKDMKAQPEDLIPAAKEIHNFYTQGKGFKANRTKLVEYFSDQGFTRAVRKHAELASKYTDTYFYQFAYKGRPGGVSKPVVGHSDSVFHVEDLFYLYTGVFGQQNAKDWSKWHDMDRTTAQRMITMWTNFAKSGNPTPSEMEILQNVIWPKYDSDAQKYLDIGSTLEIRDHPKEEVYRLWEKVYSKYGSEPFDSY